MSADKLTPYAVHVEGCEIAHYTIPDTHQRIYATTEQQAAELACEDACVKALVAPWRPWTEQVQRHVRVLGVDPEDPLA